MPDLAAIRAETSGRPPMVPIDLTPIQRCTSVKYTFGWCILGYTSPPPRGSRRYTKKLQAVTCVPSQNICSTLCSALFFDKDTTTIRFFHFFQRCPPKRFPNCFISLHFSPPKSHAPKDTAKYIFLLGRSFPISNPM